ncbi:MAG: TatD family deoxyribonuclease [Deltaproteobacteria bacterium]|nr:TatD family deoxyribonuclease [Deltaproteobacteria bacterium]
MSIDTHAHLEMETFDRDREEVLKRAAEAGLTAIVTVGTTLSDCRKAVDLAGQYPPIYAAIGIHPHEVKGIETGTYDALRLLARRDKVVAIGEIGLDFFYNHSPREVQLRRFAEQLDLAEELDLPVIIHDREAHAETLEILRPRKGRLGGVLHCFSGDRAMARECLDMGFHLSVAGPVTYPKADQLREVARDVPLERLLIETDAPYLAPQRHRGKRNEPAYVVETAGCLAEVRRVSVDELIRLTSANARRLFRIGNGETV